MLFMTTYQHIEMPDVSISKKYFFSCIFFYQQYVGNLNSLTILFAVSDNQCYLIWWCFLQWRRYFLHWFYPYCNRAHHLEHFFHFRFGPIHISRKPMVWKWNLVVCSLFCHFRIVGAWNLWNFWEKHESLYCHVFCFVIFTDTICFDDVFYYVHS